MARHDAKDSSRHFAPQLSLDVDTCGLPTPLHQHGSADNSFVPLQDYGVYDLADRGAPQCDDRVQAAIPSRSPGDCEFDQILGAFELSQSKSFHPTPLSLFLAASLLSLLLGSPLSPSSPARDIQILLRLEKVHPFTPLPLLICAEFLTTHRDLDESVDVQVQGVLEVLKDLSSVNNIAQEYLSLQDLENVEIPREYL